MVHTCADPSQSHTDCGKAIHLHHIPCPLSCPLLVFPVYLEVTFPPIALGFRNTGKRNGVCSDLPQDTHQSSADAISQKLFARLDSSWATLEIASLSAKKNRCFPMQLEGNHFLLRWRSTHPVPQLTISPIPLHNLLRQHHLPCRALKYL